MLRRRFRDLTNNLKLIRREVVDRLQLRQPGFAVNAETGLQPLLMGCSVKEVPISWINRSPDMGISSFQLLRVGGGYWQVLFGLWFECLFGMGPYKGLVKSGEMLEPRPVPHRTAPLVPEETDELVKAGPDSPYKQSG